MKHLFVYKKKMCFTVKKCFFLFFAVVAKAAISPALPTNFLTAGSPKPCETVG